MKDEQESASRLAWLRRFPPALVIVAILVGLVLWMSPDLPRQLELHYGLASFQDARPKRLTVTFTRSGRFYRSVAFDLDAGARQVADRASLPPGAYRLGFQIDLAGGMEHHQSMEVELGGEERVYLVLGRNRE